MLRTNFTRHTTPCPAPATFTSGSGQSKSVTCAGPPMPPCSTSCQVARQHWHRDDTGGVTTISSGSWWRWWSLKRWRPTEKRQQRDQTGSYSSGNQQQQKATARTAQQRMEVDLGRQLHFPAEICSTTLRHGAVFHGQESSTTGWTVPWEEVQYITPTNIVNRKR